MPCTAAGVARSSPADEPCSSERSQSTGYTNVRGEERSPRRTAESHRGHWFPAVVVFFNSLVFCLFVCFTRRSPQTQTGAPSVKAGGGGGAASSTRLKLEPHGRTPSYCCSHSAAFAEQCVTPFTYKLRISPWKAWAGLLSLRVGSKQQVYQFKEGKHCFSLFKK